MGTAAIILDYQSQDIGISTKVTEEEAMLFEKVVNSIDLRIARRKSRVEVYNQALQMLFFSAKQNRIEINWPKLQKVATRLTDYIFV